MLNDLIGDACDSKGTSGSNLSSNTASKRDVTLQSELVIAELETEKPLQPIHIDDSAS